VSDSGRDPLHERILQDERCYGLLADARGVLVGLSGGQDSLALLHALVVMDEVAAEVAAIHVHHGMRGAEADADEAAVRAICDGLGVECFVARRRVPEEASQSGLSVELAGRRARYEEYERAAREHRFDRIATGHTGSDRAETLLLNLLRGAGLRGMTSIPPRRGAIIRPLICATRRETGDYCRRHGLPIRTDRTNLDPDHARRNALRLQIMPLIEDSFPGAEAALMRACETAEEELAWTEPLIRAWLDDATLAADPGKLELAAESLGLLPEGARHRLIISALDHARGDLDQLGREHIEAIEALATRAGSGAALELPGRWRARREYERVIIERAREEDAFAEEWAPLPIPGEATLRERRVTVYAKRETAPADLAEEDASVAWIDAAGACGGLVLRSVRPGDRFVPLGMTGSKKLQDFFVDEKVPRRRRACAAVVTDGDGRIVWVVGHRVAEQARARSGAPAVRLVASVSDGIGGGTEEDV